MKHSHLTWVEIDKLALKNNLTSFQKLVGGRIKIMPVIKSNAYGHGLIEVSKIISGFSEIFGVVSLQEADELRKSGFKKRIMVLSYFAPDELARVNLKNIILPVYSPTMAAQISSAAKKRKSTVSVHIKIDVGTSRLGVSAENSKNFFDQINKLPGLRIDGVFSHLADSENFDQKFTNLQTKIFSKTVELLESGGFKIKNKHLACSAAALINPVTRFNLARVGIGLYGLWPSEETKKLYTSKYNSFKLKPALNWKTRIILIKKLDKGSCIGYGCAYKTKKQSVIGVLPVGYWDGYDRKLSNKGYVLIKGKKAKIVGRICMNMCMIDITGIGGVRVGETAILIGHDGSIKISAEEIAGLIGTINYEVVARINPLIPRVII